MKRLKLNEKVREVRSRTGQDGAVRNDGQAGFGLRALDFASEKRREGGGKERGRSRDYGTRSDGLESGQGVMKGAVGTGGVMDGM